MSGGFNKTKFNILQLGTASQHLQDIVKDTRRFLLSQKGIIEIAPLQVYVSALIFSPTDSLTRRLFSQEELSWIELKLRVEANWNACLQTLEGHNDSVASVVFSNDGQRLASGSHDKTVKIWDATSGACLQTLEGHNWEVRSVVFSNDGQRLASASDDRTVKIWDATSGACLQTLLVGRTIFHYSFDRINDSRLYTDIGVLNLDMLTSEAMPLVNQALWRHSHCYGFGVGVDGVWIMKGGQRVLWLPPEYRPVVSAVAGSRVGLGCRSGRVLTMGFSYTGRHE